VFRSACRDCRQHGHSSKRSKACPQNAEVQGKFIDRFLIVLDSLNICLKTLNTAQRQREQGTRRRHQNAANPNHVSHPYPHCGSLTHSSSRSKYCPSHSESTKLLLQGRLGPKYEYYTRKCLFDNVVRPQYRDILREKVDLLSSHLRSVIVRSQILANSYFISTAHPIPAICFTQNFYYTLMQIVLEQQITTTNTRMPLEEINRIWADLKESHPSLSTPPITTLRRSKDVLTEACVTLATSYVNNITDNFEGRVKHFVKFKMAQKFPVRHSSLV
jgi:hypothetical protein